MTNLYNVKSIEIRGEKIEKVATFYNPNFKDKNKIIPTLAYLDSVPSTGNFDFNKQHQSNILNDEIIVDASSEPVSDITYKSKISINDTFNYVEDALSDCTHDRVYLSSKARNLNGDEVYDLFNIEFASYNSDKYNFDYYSTDSVVSRVSFNFYGEVGRIYKLSNYFFGSGTNLIKFANPSKQKIFYKDVKCTESYAGSTTINAEVVYYKAEKIDEVFDFVGNNANYNIAEPLLNTDLTNKIFEGTEKNTINVSNSKIKEIVVSDKTSIISLNITANAADDLKIYYPNCDIKNIVDAKSSHLYISGKYTSHIIDLSNGPENLHLPADYFDNVEITWTTTVGMFGDFSNTNVETIYVKNNLNTKLSDENLLTVLERILKISNVVLE